MRTYVLFLFLISSVHGQHYAFKSNTFDHTYQEIGRCDTRHTTGCNVSIALALAGFEENILESEHHPVWFPPNTFPSAYSFWHTPHNPTTWIQNSCVWYLVQILDRLGPDRTTTYLKQWGYGNADISDCNALGFPRSLQISVDETLDFLHGLVQQSYALHPKTYAMTRNLLQIQTLWGGYTLFGKTGVGVDSEGIETGWFIGWIEKGDDAILFCSCLHDPDPLDHPASLEAKNRAMTHLFHLITRSLS